ncbi:nuclear pore complex assembly-domain-containing protein [Cubamyces lactineus]|nr:nuclear pore complex assembly-domain-containing protein [Cubamyces lactineus]
MDVDMSMTSEEDLMQYFDLAPEQFAWRAPRLHDIHVRRAHMSNMLFFDILISSGGIRHSDSLFPPTDPESLQKLLEAIRQSTYDVLKQDSLIYYLLKWHQDGREDDFREKRHIPPQFAALSDAYWHLDSGINVARAVSLLSDARLNRDYPSKTLQALSLAEDASTLIRTYVRTANPLLTEPNDIDSYAIALAESSLLEAWSYQRSFSETDETRRRLIRKILDWSLTPKPRLAPLKHLLAFPFSPYEQTLVHAYALDPPPHVPAASIPVIQDLVCVRLVQSGQHAAAIKLDRQFSSVPRGGDKGQKIAQERRQMMDELMASMPAAERYLLELELENFAQGRGLNLSDSVNNAKPKGKTMDTSASNMSWEHIATPPANGATSISVGPPTLPIPQRSNAPRFGGAPPSISATGAPFTTASRGPPAAPSTLSGLQMPKPPNGPLLFGAAPSQPSGSTSISAGGLFNKSAATAPGNVLARGGSIFDLTGSANAVPNAFYQPPPGAGQKRSMFGSLNASTGSRPPAPTSAFATLSAPQAKPAGGAADTSIHGPHDADISMLSELSDADSAGGDASMARSEKADRTREEDESPSGFTQSVFGNIPSAHTRPIATSTGSRIARTETEARLPPGAFLPDDEHDEDVERDAAHREEHHAEVESISATRTRGTRKPRASGSASATASASASARTRARARRSPSPEQPSARTSTRSTRAKKAVKDQDLGRSIPGSLMDDDDEDEDDAEPEQEQEQEDVVAPLPTPARRSSRKSRLSNGSSAPTVEAPRMTRRSSRLSAVSSSSPEPVSPQKVSTKARRGARASMAGTATSSAAPTKSAGTTKSSTRKRRA